MAFEIVTKGKRQILMENVDRKQVAKKRDEKSKYKNEIWKSNRKIVLK